MAGIKPSTALRENRQAVLDIAERHGAYNVRVFGSVARGEDSSRSDLDLLVDLDEDRSLWDLAELSADVEEALKCRVQIVESESLHLLLKDRNLGEAQPL